METRSVLLYMLVPDSSASLIAFFDSTDERRPGGCEASWLSIASKVLGCARDVHPALELICLFLSGWGAWGSPVTLSTFSFRFLYF